MRFKGGHSRSERGEATAAPGLSAEQNKISGPDAASGCEGESRLRTIKFGSGKNEGGSVQRRAASKRRWQEASLASEVPAKGRESTASELKW